MCGPGVHLVCYTGRPKKLDEKGAHTKPALEASSNSKKGGLVQAVGTSNRKTLNESVLIAIYHVMGFRRRYTKRAVNALD